MHRLLCHLSNENVDNYRNFGQVTHGVVSFTAIVFLDVLMRRPLDVVYASFSGEKRTILLVVIVAGLIRLCVNSNNQQNKETPTWRRIRSLSSAIFSVALLLAITNCLLCLVSFYFSTSSAIVVSTIPFLISVAYIMKKLMVAS